MATGPSGQRTNMTQARLSSCSDSPLRQVCNRAHFFAFDLPQSDASYVRAYRAATAETWVDGHVHSFFGAVALSIVVWRGDGAGDVTPFGEVA